MRRPARRAAVLAAALALAACGSDRAPPAPTTFTFVPLAGMACADGSGTGVALSGASAEAVLVFLNGGGACWAAGACDASRGPFGAAETALAQLLVAGTILDRSLAGNPFAGWSIVFVPYCTGDVHAGDSARSYGGVSWQHRGRRNVEAALDFAAARFPRATRVVLAGSSAGGFGALFSYDLLRDRFPSATAALVDDSGPTFVTSATPAALRAAWWDAWNLASTVDPTCPGCRDDVSLAWDGVSSRHPADRLALLSTTDDATMRAFLGGLVGSEFEAGLSTLAAKLETLPAANARTFRVGDDLHKTDHALLAAPARYAAGGTSLLDWLGPVATGAGSFASKGP